MLLCNIMIEVPGSQKIAAARALSRKNVEHIIPNYRINKSIHDYPYALQNLFFEVEDNTTDLELLLIYKNLLDYLFYCDKKVEQAVMVIGTDFQKLEYFTNSEYHRNKGLEAKRDLNAEWEPFFTYNDVEYYIGEEETYFKMNNIPMDVVVQHIDEAVSHVKLVYPEKTTLYKHADKKHAPKLQVPTTNQQHET